ncbi:hypothetical protein QAD02_020503 [Eretmocerus hayati]|uniref:Uncharacterized protein n=1 Tax=Eretmocerus hayati TaxID=131215 RepID=A0ACC2PMP9_9HYME|nr:hypothetical protein QAD02_020503 [Eretmocerus hayati]
MPRKSGDASHSDALGLAYKEDPAPQLSRRRPPEEREGCWKRPGQGENEEGENTYTITKRAAQDIYKSVLWTVNPHRHRIVHRRGTCRLLSRRVCCRRQRNARAHRRRAHLGSSGTCQKARPPTKNTHSNITHETRHTRKPGKLTLDYPGHSETIGHPALEHEDNWSSKAIAIAQSARETKTERTKEYLEC